MYRMRLVGLGGRNGVVPLYTGSTHVVLRMFLQSILELCRFRIHRERYTAENNYAIPCIVRFGSTSTRRNTETPTRKDESPLLPKHVND